jgi:hypothetical protein
MSTNPFVRAGRRLRRGLLAAVLAACALPAAASATTVSIDNNGTLRYFDGRGATNNLFAREDGSAIFITDTARVDPVSFAPGSIAHLCTRVNTSTVRCPFDAGPVRIKRFSAKMGDGNDSARVNVLSVPVEIEGQGGSDQYIGGGSSTSTAGPTRPTRRSSRRAARRRPRAASGSCPCARPSTRRGPAGRSAPCASHPRRSTSPRAGSPACA